MKTHAHPQPISEEQAASRSKFRRVYSPIFAEALRQVMSSRSDGQRASSAAQVIAQAKAAALATMQQKHPELMQENAPL